MSQRNKIETLLADWSAGNETALDRLIPLVYDEMRRLAHRYMRREHSNSTLQTTALVHEAYLRLANSAHVRFESRSHFLAVAARVMRHLLVDHARGVKRAKRGGGTPAAELHEVAVLSDSRADEVITVNSALDNLASIDPRKSTVFELRYFGGLSIDEAAEALRVSPATVARDWRMAKAWLRREISRGA